MEKRFSELAWPEPDQVAEELIAVCMVSHEAAERASEMITPEDMPTPTMTGVFTAIKSLLRSAKRPSPSLIAEEMKRLGVAPTRADGSSLGVAEALAQVRAKYDSGVNIDTHCEILLRYSTRRRLRLAGHKLVDLSADDTLETTEYAAKAEALITEATSQAQTPSEPKRVGQIIRDQLSMHRARKKGDFEGLRTGFGDLDAKLRGVKPGDMIVLAARPSMGKTAFAQNLTDNWARMGRKPLFVSAEMPDEQIGNRIIASVGGVNHGMMVSGMLEADRWPEVDRRLSVSGLLEADYWIDSSSSTVADIRAKAQRLKRRYGLDAILIDYLQLLKPGTRYRGNREQEVSEISSDCKRLARELGVPVVVLSQLSRAVERRDDKRPLLSDLRESGSIEQDADVVMFLYRDAYYHPNTDKKNETEVIVAKNRNGPIGKVHLEFIPERTAFISVVGKGA